jgi:hypothetical protein
MVNRDADLSNANPWVVENVLSPMVEYRPQYPDLAGGDSEPLHKIKKDLLFWTGQNNNVPEKCEFYGYFADYDWVIFCWIFGRMIDLPKGYPYYCRDLKQMMDDMGLDSNWKDKRCPDPKDEHNALADAIWNKSLYEALESEKFERMRISVR